MKDVNIKLVPMPLTCFLSTVLLLTSYVLYHLFEAILLVAETDEAISTLRSCLFHMQNYK